MVFLPYIKLQLFLYIKSRKVTGTHKESYSDACHMTPKKKNFFFVWVRLLNIWLPFFRIESINVSSILFEIEWIQKPELLSLHVTHTLFVNGKKSKKSYLYIINKIDSNIIYDLWISSVFFLFLDIDSILVTNLFSYVTNPCRY